MQNKEKIASITGIVVFLIFIFVISSFQTIEYNEYAFKKNEITNRVNTEKVYSNGRHFWGWFTSAIFFPRDYQQVILNNLAVADKEQKSFRIDISVWYRHNITLLPTLYDNFGTRYEETIKSKIESTVKNIIPEFSIQEFMTNRDEIANYINGNVTQELIDIHIQVDASKFKLRVIYFEESTEDKFLKIAIQKQENERKLYEQEAQLIRTNTTKQVNEIDSEGNLVLREAAAEASQIVNFANAEYDEITNNAKSNSIGELLLRLNITESSNIKEFLRLISILDNPNIRILDIDSENIIIS